MVSRFVGGAVGVAVVGSLLSSVYTGRLRRDAGLSLARVAAAQGSLQRALEIAAGLPRAAGEQLASAARDAFDSGARSAISQSRSSPVAAVWVWRALRPGPAAHPPGVEAGVSVAPRPRP